MLKTKFWLSAVVFLFRQQRDKCMLSWFSFFLTIYLLEKFLGCWGYELHLGRVKKWNVMLSVTFSCLSEWRGNKKYDFRGLHTQSLRLLQLGSCSNKHLFQYPKDCSVLLQAVQLWQTILNRLEIPSKVLKRKLQWLNILGTLYAEGRGLIIEWFG